MDRALLNDIYQALDPIAFWIGPFAVRWYGLGYILGILIGGYIVFHACKRWNIRFSLDALLTVFIAATVGIILGGRLGYVLFYNAGYYFANPAEILAFSNGGMSFHGGVIGMALAAWIASRIIKMPLLTLADLIVIAAPVGICLVRVTNFINGELWGAPTDLPWGVEFESGGGVARHPSQLYEALLEGVVIFIVLQVLSRKKQPLSRGGYLGIFLILYGIFRITVEFVREPDVQLGYLAGGWLTMGMVLCIPMLVIGIALLVYAAKTRHPQQGLPELQPAIEQALEDELELDGETEADAEAEADAPAGEELTQEKAPESENDSDDAEPVFGSASKT